MTKRPDILFEHMFGAIMKIEEYIEGYDLDKFLTDSKTSDAVIRQFEILGEAAGQIPKDLISDSPIPWKYLIGFRHKLIHDYLGVNLHIVWETASESIKPLKKYLKSKIES